MPMTPAERMAKARAAKAAKKLAQAESPDVTAPIVPKTAGDLSGEFLKIPLAGRHREWLERTAHLHGRSIENMAEFIIRKAYAADSTKGGLYDSGKEQTAMVGGYSSRHPLNGSSE